jgi:hypothetical protein
MCTPRSSMSGRVGTRLVRGAQPGDASRTGLALLCNGAIVFDDLGALLPTTPTATSVQPPRPAPRLRAVRTFPARPAAVPAGPVLPAAA